MLFLWWFPTYALIDAQKIAKVNLLSLALYSTKVITLESILWWIYCESSVAVESPLGTIIWYVSTQKGHLRCRGRYQLGNKLRVSLKSVTEASFQQLTICLCHKNTNRCKWCAWCHLPRGYRNKIRESLLPAVKIKFSLSGVPELFDRNKILSGGDLSHYQVPHCIRVFFYFVWFVFIHHNFQFYFELCTCCNILDIYLS